MPCREYTIAPCSGGDGSPCSGGDGNACALALPCDGSIPLVSFYWPPVPELNTVALSFYGLLATDQIEISIIGKTSHQQLHLGIINDQDSPAVVTETVNTPMTLGNIYRVYARRVRAGKVGLWSWWDFQATDQAYDIIVDGADVMTDGIDVIIDI